MGEDGVVRFVERKAQNLRSLLHQAPLWANSPVLSPVRLEGARAGAGRGARPGPTPVRSGHEHGLVARTRRGGPARPGHRPRRRLGQRPPAAQTAPPGAAGRGGGVKKEAEVLAQFDGRGRIEIVLRGFRVARAGRIQAIAQEMGYALHSREGRSNDVVRLHFIRDDNPLARRRAEETQARIAAGGPCCCRGRPPAQSASAPSAASAAASAPSRGRTARPVNGEATRTHALPGGAGGFGASGSRGVTPRAVPAVSRWLPPSSRPCRRPSTGTSSRRRRRRRRRRRTRPP